MIILKFLLAEMKRVKYEDIEDMVKSLELTYEEIVDMLDIKYINGTIIGYVLPSGIYQITDTESMINSLPADDVKVNITVDDIRIRTNLTTNKTKVLLKSFFYIPN